MALNFLTISLGLKALGIELGAKVPNTGIFTNNLLE